MKTKYNAALYRLVRLADEAGLSYGAYVAREYDGNAWRSGSAEVSKVGGSVGGEDGRAFGGAVVDGVDGENGGAVGDGVGGEVGGSVGSGVGGEVGGVGSGFDSENGGSFGSSFGGTVGGGVVGENGGAFGGIFNRMSCGAGCRLTTLREALPIDCPSFCTEEDLGKPRRGDASGTLDDEELIGRTVRLYRMGYSAEAIGKRLGAEDSAVIRTLRRAENELKTHRRSLPPDKALEVISLNERGVSYRNIAAKCNVTLTAVIKCLNGRRTRPRRRREYDDEILF